MHTRSWQAAYESVFGAKRLATIDRAGRERWWGRCIREGLETVLVAEERGGGVIAFASVGSDRDDATRGELYAIYALPEAWGTGAGHALMDEAVAALRDAGHADAVLWVLADNPRARRFYEREGWTADARRRARNGSG